VLRFRLELGDSTGLIHSIGDWVMRQACGHIAAWAKDPHADQLTLSVNVSALQFRDPGFADRVATIVRESGANPNRLWIELTESMFHAHLDTSVRSIQGLHQAGSGSLLMILVLDILHWSISADCQCSNSKSIDHS
jgi:EAL domain-containing protein (putative c-di-GMP-specific phosphodiesterase class I)